MIATMPATVNDAPPRSSPRLAVDRASERFTITAVIPTLNEAANLPYVFARLPTFVDEVIVVDGHSVDNTVEVARALRPEVRVVFQNGRGKGNALACGFAAAGGDIIVMLDGDGWTDPLEIPRFIEPLLAGADFVKGSRFVDGGSSSDITWLRGVGNRALRAAVNVFYGTSYTDLCYGYNAFWSRCLPQMHITCDGFEVETLISVRIARAGLSTVEVPSQESKRLFGTSNLSAFHDGIRILKTIVRERVRCLPPATVDWYPEYNELPRLSATDALTMVEFASASAPAQ